MKAVITLSRITISCALLLTTSVSLNAQQPISSIITDNIVNPQISYTGVKGAGLRSPLGTLVSSWDSTGTSFNVNYNRPGAANTLRLSQFSVPGLGSQLLTMPVSAIVEIRRASNPDVGNAREIFNFWARYSSAPAALATSGTFNFTSPEVTNPEVSFLSNNLLNGYDNIFQNTTANPHYANIERIDFIIPAGLRITNNNDRTQSGVAVIDRGTGDAFKIAAITAVDGTNTPTAFGSLISVAAANFGGDLLNNSFNYAIMINDPQFRSQSRPSTQTSQNLRGVYISLADLGLTVGQRFYGYALFGPDVTVAHRDWTTYPTNTSSASQLDPVNLMGIFRTSLSVLPLPITFSATRVNQSSNISFNIYNEYNGEYVTVQRSSDGISFTDIDKIKIESNGVYEMTDKNPLAGSNFYRLQMVDQSGNVSATETRLLKFEEKANITLFPNPAIDKLNISFPSSWMQESVIAEIYTTNGQLVKRMQFEKPGMQQTVTVNNLQRGTYVLKVVKKGVGAGSNQSFTVL